MLTPATLAAVDAYWAEFLGCGAHRLRPPEPLVVPHTAALAGYTSAYLQRFGDAAPVATLPPALAAETAPRVAAALRDGLIADGRWAEIFGDRFRFLIGPATVRYADSTTLRPIDDDRVRLLTNTDLPSVESLRRAVDPTEWEHGGSGTDDRLAGAFVDGELAALAGYEVWGGAIAHLAIVTHPAYRRRGLAAPAVSLLAREALDRGLVPQYRALESNTPSIAISDRLGFLPYARSLAIRLTID